MTDPRLAVARSQMERDLAFLLHKISTLGGTLTGGIVGMDTVTVIWDDDEVAS